MVFKAVTVILAAFTAGAPALIKQVYNVRVTGGGLRYNYGRGLNGSGVTRFTG